MAAKPRVHILGTGGSISGIGPHRLDYTLYPDVGKKLTVQQLLERIPEARELAELSGEDVLQVGSPSIGPLSRSSSGTSRNSSSIEPAPITRSISLRSASLNGR